MTKEIDKLDNTKMNSVYAANNTIKKVKKMAHKIVESICTSYPIGVNILNM